MIIYPSGFPLSAAADGEPLLLPRIGWKTYTRDAGIVVTVSADTEGGPKDAPLRPDTGEYWQAPSLPAWWKIDFGIVRDLDYVGIVANLGSCGASLLAETSPDDSAWTALGYDIVPADDAPIMFLDVSRSARYLRLSVAGSGAIPKVAVAYAGPVLVMAKPLPIGYSPITLSRVTDLQNVMSQGGAFLGQSVRSRGVEGQIGFNNLLDTWYRDNFDPFVKETQQYPYFFAWAPEAFPSEVAYIWTDGGISPVYVQSNRLSVRWSAHGIGHE